MKKLVFLVFVSLFLVGAANAQDDKTKTVQTTAAQAETKPKKKVFRANKEQITQAQKMLKVAESGKMDADTRAAVKTFQSANGLKATGSLNRATLEKMNIALTDAQKEIPVSPNSFAAEKSEKSGDAKKRGAVFRANKEQIVQAQKMLKVTETGKLDDATREALKKYQTDNGIKSTGTLNRVTLEKMGIALTDKQKAM